MPPIKRKPVACEATGFQKVEMLPGKFDIQEDTRNCLHLQAARVRNQFALSWPVARVIAEIHFGRPA